MVTDVAVSDEKMTVIGALKSGSSMIMTFNYAFPHLLQCHSQVLLLLESHKV